MNKNKRVTSYDVARVAGVSQSVVSRVFIEGRSVSKKNREKVLKTANKLGYRPNAIARSLSLNKSGIVAVVISTRESLIFPELLSIINKHLAERNKRLILFTLDNTEELEDLFEQIRTYQVEGVISLSVHFNPKMFALTNHRKVPVVVYNSKVDGVTASSVGCNQEEGTNQLVELLVEQGHKNFLIVSGPNNSDVAIQRRDYAIQALQQHGITDVPIVIGEYTYRSGKKALHEYIANNEIPSAVICGNDSMALGVIDEARSNNLSVPNDISIVGFDGIGISRLDSYNLTTIEQPIEVMTKAAVDMLLHKIEQPDEPAQTRIWAGKLVNGKTVGKAQNN